jgi:hypothetical protein
MYNQEVWFDNATSGGPNAWVYSPVKYWPNGIDAANAAGAPSNTAKSDNNDRLSFFAYAPYKAMADFTTPGTGTPGTEFPSVLVAGSNFKTASGTNGIIAMTTNEFTGNVWVKYLMPNANQNEAVDLLWGTNGKASYDETDNSSTSTAIGAGYNVNLTKQTVGEKVKFLFKHALTKIGGQTTTTENVEETPGASDKIGFKIIADVDGNNGDFQTTYFPAGFNKAQTLITLKAIRIQDGMTATTDPETSVTGITTNSGIYNSGWFNIETGSWEEQSITGEGSKISIVAKSDAENQTNATDDKYSINPDIREAASYSKNAGSGAKKLADGDAKWDDAKPTGVDKTAVPVFAKETVPGVTLIPGAADQKLYITVDYFVRTADKNLANGYTQVEQKITNEVSLASLQSNKYYTIIIHLGMTSVKFEAVVADWETANNGTFDEDGHYTPDGGATPNETKVWLPSNVVVVTP